ncbi:hypothetical protein [Aphanothece minutissima]|uniref:hypothetical protein n=1 Tax=Aphanothece minutissima TaxID=543815 RepID=UPI0011B25F79|nr:hypothetical protein [Aphanothece minutissima]
MSRSEWRSHEFALVVHWTGVALSSYFLVDLAFQAWPVALLKPAWLDQMSGFLVGRSATPLIGVLLIAAASEIDHRSTALAKRSAAIRRLATWVAIGYLLLIPVQLYAGVKLLHEQQQIATQQLTQARRALEAIQASTTDLQLRRAYQEIPGDKAPLPDPLPLPLDTVKGRLVEAMDSRNKKAQYDFDQKMSTLWQRSLGLLFGNILRMLILFVGFAALGRPSPGQPTLLTQMMNRPFISRGMADRFRPKDMSAVVPDGWIEDDKMIP